jgi:hypothetical protein
MEKLFSAPVVVAFWGLLNVVALVVLAGFLGGPFGGHMIELYIYIGSALLVFLLAALVWLARRRQPQGLSRGLVVPRRPASALLLALAFMLLWLGLAFGMWLPIIGVFPLVAAGLMEWFALRGSRKLPAARLSLRLRPGPGRSGSGRSGPDRPGLGPGRPGPRRPVAPAISGSPGGSGRRSD